jgi:hypothetical protein
MKWFTKLDDSIQYVIIIMCAFLLLGIGYLIDKLIDKL